MYSSGHGGELAPWKVLRQQPQVDHVHPARGEHRVLHVLDALDVRLDAQHLSGLAQAERVADHHRPALGVALRIQHCGHHHLGPHAGAVAHGDGHVGEGALFGLA
jgi:membrane protein required for beta-lactamase induction